MSAKQARTYAEELTAEALAQLEPFGVGGQRLAEIARFIVERRY
jgi:geranylgeranyl pyrophosphate synthase